MSHTSSRIYEQFEALFGKSKKENHYHDIIQNHYGNRPFKCGYINCTFRRHGFEARTLRNLHMRHHDRPWKCGFSGCEFQDGGFLSRKMRDEHLGRFHQEPATVAISAMEKPDKDEIQPLLFDLVKSDNVQMVKGLLQEFDALEGTVKTELRQCAARFGSPTMIDLIYQLELQTYRYDLVKSLHKLLVSSMEGNNQEVFRHLMLQYRRISAPKDAYGPDYSPISELLISDSEEILDELNKHVDFMFETWNPKVADAAAFVSARMVAVTAGKIHREQVLGSIWRKHVIKIIGTKYAGDALVNVSSSTCSVRLAKVLIDHGVSVDHRRSGIFLTPLHHAARKTTAAAAELMKFLLFCGADPEAVSTRATLKIREEKGAIGISKWLGISWDELVAQAREKIEKENRK